jgi:hypothetical protein
MSAPVSHQALVCPACASPFVEFFATSFGPELEMPEKPETVACTGPRQHKYPVLQVDSTSSGQRLYTLGAEIAPA